MKMRNMKKEGNGTLKNRNAVIFHSPELDDQFLQYFLIIFFCLPMHFVIRLLIYKFSTFSCTFVDSVTCKDFAFGRMMI